MRPLLSASQLGAIQGVALSGMQTPIIIKRPVVGSDELGDDATDPAPAVVVQPDSVLVGGVLLGNLRQIGGDVTGGIDVSRIQTTSTFELGLPIGTNVLTRDIAVIFGHDYIVQDVLDDETWPAMLNCILRHGT
jgi:hypothetical protein